MPAAEIALEVATGGWRTRIDTPRPAHLMRASPVYVSPVALLRTLAGSFRSPLRPDPPFLGVRLASVEFSQDLLSDSGLDVRGTLVLYRKPDGLTRIGVEMPHPVWGGLWAPVRRRSFSLDDILEVRWEPGRWGGELVLTAMARDGFACLPGNPRDRFPVRVARSDRAQAQAFAQAVALADLPD